MYMRILMKLLLAYTLPSPVVQVKCSDNVIVHKSFARHRSLRCAKIVNRRMRHTVMNTRESQLVGSERKACHCCWYACCLLGGEMHMDLFMFEGIPCSLPQQCAYRACVQPCKNGYNGTPCIHEKYTPYWAASTPKLTTHYINMWSNWI